MPVHTISTYKRKQLGQPFTKINADDHDLSIGDRSNLFITSITTSEIMGPAPIPSLMIEIDEIDDKFQKMMVEEIKCVVCGEFPHKPLEC
jgi:hypothetical protein